jgi:hypothetical protein
VSRIFTSLAVVAILLVMTAIILGLGLDKNAYVAEIRDSRAHILELRRSSTVSAAELAASSDRLRDAERKLNDERVRGSAHMLTGVAAALGVVLVACIAVTYFIGTSRWCREVVEAYSLEEDLIVESRSLKRRSFPWALAAMLTMVGVSALGAASDPGTGNVNSARWVIPHLAAALSGLALVCVCFFFLWVNIAANQQVIERILRRVEQERAARGAATAGEPGD